MKSTGTLAGHYMCGEEYRYGTLECRSIRKQGRSTGTLEGTSIWKQGRSTSRRSTSTQESASIRKQGKSTGTPTMNQESSHEETSASANRVLVLLNEISRTLETCNYYSMGWDETYYSIWDENTSISWSVGNRQELTSNLYSLATTLSPSPPTKYDPKGLCYHEEIHWAVL